MLIPYGFTVFLFRRKSSIRFFFGNKILSLALLTQSIIKSRYWMALYSCSILRSKSVNST
jgi:hypothetical protein